MSIVAGAIAGAATVFVIDAASRWQFDVSLTWALYGVGALLGGALGGGLGPLAFFGFLRRVPLGRFFLETALGAAAGGLLGLGLLLTVSPRGDDLVVILGAGVLGFSAAAARLWWRFRAAPVAHIGSR